MSIFRQKRPVFELGRTEAGIASALVNIVEALVAEGQVSVGPHLSSLLAETSMQLRALTGAGLTGEHYWEFDKALRDSLKVEDRP